jgi:hypothetical protein
MRKDSVSLHLCFIFKELEFLKYHGLSTNGHTKLVSNKLVVLKIVLYYFRSLNFEILFENFFLKIS